MGKRAAPPVFRFHHGRLSLSFAGTVGDRGSAPLERLTEPKALVDWLLAAGLIGRRVPPPNGRTFAEALRLREAIAGVTRAIVDGRRPAGADVTLINAGVRRWGSQPQLDPRTLATREAVSDPVQAALGRLARDTVELVGDQNERARLRTCGLDSCGSVFLTPPGRDRRWCSMQRCGNRAKVAAFRERQK
jgi:predicted RNA-binding Zn ribbon-like protein